MRGLRYLIIAPVLLLSAFIAVGISNYQNAKEEMRQDLTCALRQFVLDESQQTILLDTIPSLHRDRVLTLSDVESSFNDQLTILPLKDTSHVSVCLLRQDDRNPFKEEASVCSDTLMWQQESGDAIIALKAYANPSFCAVLCHSNQRLPLSGIILSLLMISVMVWRTRMSGKRVELALSSIELSKREMHLTPMQEQLMDMFASAPDHILSKESICSALWPKKERPENTLYTFICRMKATIKEQSGMDIVNVRGKEYKLVDSSKTPDSQDDK